MGQTLYFVFGLYPCMKKVDFFIPRLEGRRLPGKIKIKIEERHK